MEHKPDEEIKRCLKICTSNDCEGCGYVSSETGKKTCTDYLLEDALYLINKREKQIVDLTDEHAKQIIKLANKFGVK